MKTQKEYQRKIIELEEKLFPELNKLDPHRMSNFGLEGSNYLFYRPNHFFEVNKPLLTEDIVNDLRENDRQILSVGCGPAYLERLLVEGLGVKPEQVVLSDISENHIPSGFEFYQFDMIKEWPDFGKEFDYIIFPESVLITTEDIDCQGINLYSDYWSCSSDAEFSAIKHFINNLSHIVANSLKVLKSPGQIRIGGHCYPKWAVSDDVLKEHGAKITEFRSKEFLVIKK